MSEINVNSREAIRTRSDFEKKVIMSIPAGHEFFYEPIKVQYSSCHNYIPDIVLGNGIIVEVKGYLDAGDRRKMREVKSQHPELDIRFVFANSKNKLAKERPATYADWCHRYGFQFADGEIPAEWFEEEEIINAKKRTRTMFANKVKEIIKQQIEEEENELDLIYEEEAAEMEAAEAEKAKAAAQNAEAEATEAECEEMEP